MRIGILAYAGCVASGVTGFGDVLAMANHLSHTTHFNSAVCSEDGAPVPPFAGPPIMVEQALLQGDAAWDILFIPPAMGLEQPPEALVAAVKDLHAAGTILCAACAGVFFLAEAGLLQERVATTHWGLVDLFRQRYPRVRLEPERMLVDSGDVLCAGGITAYFDLALHLVARFASADLSTQCARALLLDPGRTQQTPYMYLVGAAHHGDDTITAAQEWLEARHTEPVRISALAETVHLTERTLLRRFKQATGKTPTAYLQALRMEHAKRLLESSLESVDAIAGMVGYGDAPAFFRVFKDCTGLTPGEYRRRFSVLGRLAS